MQQARAKSPILTFTLWVFAFILLIAAFLFLRQCSESKSATDIPTSSSTEEDSSGISLTADGKHVDDSSTARTGSPETLVGEIRDLVTEANNTRNAADLLDFLGHHNLSPEQSAALNKLAAQSRLKFNSGNPFNRVENMNGRWSLNLSDQNRILLDLKKDVQGDWKVDKVTLPSSGTGSTGNPINPAAPHSDAELPGHGNEASTPIHQFMKAIMNLDPAAAQKFVNSHKISYAKLAGLCIIFEEGNYTLRKKQALRQVFSNEKSAGWLVQVESTEATQTALFSINTKRKNAQSAWEISEINLDKLLANYANRFSDGDIHYAPLIINPKGGDSLAIYFDLDSQELTLRTQRQLKIVANLLKTDTKKKLTISGHTDALGSDIHNLKLSEKRARQVKAYLARQGVNTTQVSIIGYGKTLPRRPNTTADGQDAPNGRRANRRAEILLNF